MHTFEQQPSSRDATHPLDLMQPHLLQAVAGDPFVAWELPPFLPRRAFSRHNGRDMVNVFGSPTS
jgi:hypothetical protein